MEGYEQEMPSWLRPATRPATADYSGVRSRKSRQAILIKESAGEDDLNQLREQRDFAKNAGDSEFASWYLMSLAGASEGCPDFILEYKLARKRDAIMEKGPLNYVVTEGEGPGLNRTVQANVERLRSWCESMRGAYVTKLDRKIAELEKAESLTDSGQDNSEDEDDLLYLLVESGEI